MALGAYRLLVSKALLPVSTECADSDSTYKRHHGTSARLDAVTRHAGRSSDDIRQTRELWDKGGPPGWRRDSRSEASQKPSLQFTRFFERVH